MRGGIDPFSFLHMLGTLYPGVGISMIQLSVWQNSFFVSGRRGDLKCCSCVMLTARTSCRRYARRTWHATAGPGSRFDNFCFCFTVTLAAALSYLHEICMTRVIKLLTWICNFFNGLRCGNLTNELTDLQRLSILLYPQLTLTKSTKCLLQHCAYISSIGSWHVRDMDSRNRTHQKIQIPSHLFSNSRVSITYFYLQVKHRSVSKVSDKVPDSHPVYSTIRSSP